MCIACNPGAAAYLQARREFLGAMVGLGVLAVGGAALSPAAHAGTAAVASAGPADLIFHNGPIITMAPHPHPHPHAEALAVRDGRILAVGAKDQVWQHHGPNTELVDLKGRALLPGFIDPHMHSAMAILSEWLDVTPFSTRTLADAMARSARQPARSGPVNGCVHRASTRR
jgi:hypothetical protein